MRVSSTTAGPTLVNGSDIGLPMVEHVGFNHWQQAVSLPWHCHPCFEMIIFLEGSATYDLEDGSLSVAGGEFFVTLPRQLHRASNNISSPAKMFWIMFDPEAENSTTNTVFTPTDMDEIVDVFRTNERHVFAFSNEMRFHLTHLRQELIKYGEHPTASGSARLRSALCQILIEAYYNVINRPKKRSYDYVNAMKARMERDFAQPVDMDTLAGELGLSRCHLYSLFRKQTGHTPNDYLLRIRIKDAQQKLVSTDLNIADVASESGFNSSQNFCKVFRKYTGMSPTAYRHIGELPYDAAAMTSGAPPNGGFRV